MWRGLAAVLVLGCRGAAAVHDAAPADSVASDGRQPDGPGSDASGDPDGTPIRLPCSATFGNAITANSYGRLDGRLVTIIVPGTPGCRGDSGHVHLQILAGGATYDIAVNIGDDDPSTNNVHSIGVDHALLGPAWSEGWHGVDRVDYAGDLGVHAAAMPLHTRADNIAALVTELATANHISVYATGYDDSTGAHLIHRNAGGDGMIVLRPLSPVAHGLLYSFSNQQF